MNIIEFNEKYQSKFELQKEMPSRNVICRLYQWCPDAKRYEPFMCSGRWHFREDANNPDGIPQNFLDRFENRKKSILVLKEEYGDRFFDIPDTESLGLVSLKLLKQQWSAGMFTKPSNLPQEPKDLADNIKDSRLNKLCRQQWDEYRIRVQTHHSNEASYNELKKILDKQGTYFDAFSFLETHTTCSVEYLETSDANV